MNPRTTKPPLSCSVIPPHKAQGEWSWPITESNEQDSQNPLRGVAGKRANIKLGFFIHLAVFVLLSATQLGINLFTTPWVFWSVFPLMGWGLGVAIHGLVVWFKASDSREHLIDEELEKLQSPKIIETSLTSSVSVTEKPRENHR